MTSRMASLGIVGPTLLGLSLVAAATAAAAEPNAAPRQQVEQRLLQAREGFRSAAHAELELVRRTCGSLAKASRPGIVAAADQGVERAAQEFVDRLLAGQPSPGFEPRRHIHDAIAPALEPLVSAEEFAAYQREHAARVTRRERAARLRIIDRATTMLDLSVAQTAAIDADLQARWQASWLVELHDDGSLPNGLGRAPDFAAEAITPHLDERQRVVWDDWCRLAATGNGRVTRGWDGRPSQPDPWWQP